MGKHSSASESATSYARYIGRVGALAVALGVGAAVATGYGTGVARADAAPATDNAPAVDTPTDPTSPSTPEPGEQLDEPTPPAGSDDPPPEDTADEPAETEMDVEASGGLDDSTNDEGQSTDTREDGSADDTEDGDTADGETVDGDPVAESDDAGAPVQAPANTPISKKTAAPTNSGTTSPRTAPETASDTKPRAATTDTRQARASVAPLSGADDQQVAASTANASEFTAFAAPADVQSSPFGALVNLARTIVGVFLSPFLSSGPDAPAEPPLFWAVLAFVRREFSRTFFNQTPHAVADPVTTSEDTSKTFDVVGNDTDGDDADLMVTRVTQPTNGAVTINDNGTLTYTPKANFTGTDTFTYTVSDAESPFHLHGFFGFFGGGHTDTETVTVTVTAVNDAPVARNDTASTLEDTAVDIAVLANDTDAENNTLTPSVVSGPAHGTLALNADRTYTYTPNANYFGPDSFTYKINDAALDSNTATVTITITAAPNDPPIARDDTYTTKENTALTVAAPGFAGNDTEPDGDALTLVALTQPPNGTVEIAAGIAFTYTPDDGFTGTDTFTYTVSDADGATDTATVTITVTEAATNGLLANNDTYSFNLPGAIAEPAPGVLANDYSDPDGGALPDGATAQLVTGPAHDTLFTLNPDGSFVYSPEAGFTGPDTFTYRINTGTTNSAVATVTINVNPEVTNTAPQFADPAYEEDDVDIFGGIITGHMIATDADDDTLTYSLGSVPDPKLGTVELDTATGAWVYTPTPQARFDAVNQPFRAVEFTVTVSDGQETDTTTASARISPSIATAIRLGDGVEAAGSPVLRQDGTVYQTGVTVLPGVDKYRTTVVVFRPDGAPVTFELDGEPVGTVAFGPDGTAYQTVQQGHRYALDVTTTVLAINPDGTESSSVMVLNGKASAPVFVGPDGSVYQVTDNDRPAFDDVHTTVAVISPSGVRSPDITVTGGPIGEFGGKPIIFGPDGTYLTTYIQDSEAGTSTTAVTKIVAGVANPAPVLTTDGFPVGGVVFAPDGTAFQTVKTPTQTTVINIATEEVLMTAEGDPSSKPVMFGADGTAYLSTFTSDGLGALQGILSFKRPAAAVESVSRPMSYSGPIQFAPDGTVYQFVTTYATDTAPASTGLIVVPPTGSAGINEYAGLAHGLMFYGSDILLITHTEGGGDPGTTHVSLLGVSGGPFISADGAFRGIALGPGFAMYLTTETDLGPDVRPITRVSWYTLVDVGTASWDGRPVGDAVIAPDGNAYQVIDTSNPANGTSNTAVAIIHPDGSIDFIPELRGEPLAGPTMGEDGVFYQVARMYIPERDVFENVVWVLPVAGPTAPEEPEIPPV